MYSDTGHGLMAKDDVFIHLARVSVKLSNSKSCDIKINFHYYDTNVIYARAKFCSSCFRFKKKVINLLKYIAKMVFTKDDVFPSDEALTTEEVPIGSPYLKAGAQHLGKYCEPQNNEFILCRIEENDASKCLGEGKAVTSCTNQFFRQVKI